MIVILVMFSVMVWVVMVCVFLFRSMRGFFAVGFTCSVVGVSAVIR